VSSLPPEPGGVPAQNRASATTTRNGRSLALRGLPYEHARMMKTSLLVGMALAALAARAEAGGSANTIGVGAEYELSGLGGASVNYDAGQFHLGGFIGYADDGNNNSDFEIGGRFFYHLHSTAMSDFSVGGGLGLASDKRTAGGMGGMSVRNTFVFVEPSFQIRLFVASNVALSFTGGITIGAADAQGYGLTAQGVGGGSFTVSGAGVGFLGGAGVHYYFF